MDRIRLYGPHRTSRLTDVVHLFFAGFAAWPAQNNSSHSESIERIRGSLLHGPHRALCGPYSEDPRELCCMARIRRVVRHLSSLGRRHVDLFSPQLFARPHACPQFSPLQACCAQIIEGVGARSPHLLPLAAQSRLVGMPRPEHLLRHPQQLIHPQVAGAAVVVRVEGAAGRVGVVRVRPAQTRRTVRLVQEIVGDARVPASDGGGLVRIFRVLKPASSCCAHRGRKPQTGGSRLVTSRVTGRSPGSTSRCRPRPHHETTLADGCKAVDRSSTRQARCRHAQAPREPQARGRAAPARLRIPRSSVPSRTGLQGAADFRKAADFSLDFRVPRSWRFPKRARPRQQRELRLHPAAACPRC